MKHSLLIFSHRLHHLGVIIALMLVLIGCRSQKDSPDPNLATTKAPAVVETPAPAPSSIAANPATKTIIAFDPQVKTGVLANGLTYYVRKNTKPEGIAELRLAVNAGSMQEADDQVGLAHFVEHMCFNGTLNFPKSELVDYLEGIGMRFGAHLNAYTSFDETVYMLRLPTNDQEKFNKGFQILEDWATDVSFEPEEIEKERGVVISEWRTRLGGNWRIAMQVYPSQFYQSRYATRLPIGTVENLQSFPHDRLIQYYRDWYRPDLMSVVAVGDFDVEEMEKRIQAVFGAIPSRKGPERITYEVPDHEETLVAIASDPEANFNVVEITYKHPPLTIETEEDYRLDLTYDLVNNMLDTRLSELVQQENPPFSNASAYYAQMVRSKHQFSMSAIVADSARSTGLAALYREGLRASRFGFTETELARAKSSLLTTLESQYRERDKTESNRIAMRYVRHFLTQNAEPGIELQVEMAREMLPGITSKDVNEAIRHFMSPASRVISITGSPNEQHPFPTEEAVLQTLSSIVPEELEPYADNLSTAPLMSSQPEPGDVVSRQSIDSVGITELTFDNGVRVILKPTTFKNDEISMQSFSPGGLSLVEEKDFITGNMTVQAITAGGVGAYDNIQLQKFLSDKVIELSPNIAELQEGMSGSCAPQDFETFLQLVHLYFVQPRPDEAAFNSLIARIQAFYANLLNNPDIFFQVSIPKELYNQHPRKDVSKIFTDMDKVDFAKAEEIYRDRFGDAGDFTFVFVGNFDPSEIEPLLATYLGSLPSEGRKENFADTEARAVKGELSKTFFKGTEPKSQVNLIYHGEMDWNADNRYLLQSTVGVLNITLRENLREDKGGVYGVGIRGSSEKDPVQRYAITINFTCDPKDVDTLINACKQEIAALQAEGPSAQNLDKVKETQRKTIEEGLQDNDYWMEQLVFSYQYGLDPSRILQQAERIDGLTAEQVQTAAKKLFENSYAEFVLRPEEVAAPDDANGDE